MSKIVAWTGLWVFLVLPVLLAMSPVGAAYELACQLVGGIVMAVGIAMMWYKR